MSRPTFPLARRLTAARTFVRPRVFTAASPYVGVREAANSPAHRASAWETRDNDTVGERLTTYVATSRPPHIHAVVIARGDQIVAEHYGHGDDRRYGQRLRNVEFSPHTLHDLRSVTKTVTGLLYGMALERGEVPGPDQALIDHFPEHRDAMGRAGATDLKIHHVLSMTMGTRWNETGPYTSAANDEIGMELAPDRYGYILSRERTEPAGTQWRYSGGASALLGALIERGTGSTLARLAHDRLFGPLGIEHWHWMAGSDRRASAASGLRMTARDLTRLGRLFVTGGQWQGQQVVPHSWMALTTARHAGPTWAEGIDYGYQCYLAGDGTPQSPRWVGGFGNGGQRLIAIPDLDITAVVFSGNYDGANQGHEAHAVLTEVIVA